LADKSLLLVAARGVTTRYRLLETIREYAREKLAESGEEDQVRRKHALYFADLVETDQLMDLFFHPP
jgi:predicted ATPase